MHKDCETQVNIFHFRDDFTVPLYIANLRGVVCRVSSYSWSSTSNCAVLHLYWKSTDKSTPFPSVLRGFSRENTRDYEANKFTFYCCADINHFTFKLNWCSPGMESASRFSLCRAQPRDKKKEITIWRKWNSEDILLIFVVCNGFLYLFGDSWGALTRFTSLVNIKWHLPITIQL